MFKNFSADVIRVWNENADPRSEKWYLTATPFPLIGMIVAFTIVIKVLKINL